MAKPISCFTRAVTGQWNRFLANQTALPISMLLAALLGIGGLLLNSARQENLEFRALLQRQVSAGIREQIRSVGRVLIDYAVWNEFAAAANRPVPDVHWLKNNLTPSIYTNQDIDFALLLDPARHEILYAIKYGQLQPAPAHALHLTDATWRWIEGAMRTPHRKAESTAMVNLDVQDGKAGKDLLYLLAIQPVENEQGEIPARNGKLLLFARQFDPPLQAILSSSYLIQTPRIRLTPERDPERMGLPVTGLNGKPVAWLSWGFTPPGDDLMARLLPGATLLCLLLFALGLLLGRQARRLQRTQTETLARLRQQGNTLRSVVERADSSVAGDGHLQTLCEQIAITLGVERVGLWRYDPDGQALSCVAAFPDARTPADPVAIGDLADYLARLDRSRYLAIADLRQSSLPVWPFEREDGPPVLSRLDATVRVGSRLHGLFSLGCARPRSWTQDEINFICSAADALSLLTEVEARQQVEGEFARLFFYDHATGLPNRHRFRQHLDSEIAPPHPRSGACIVLALDNLTALTGAYGSEAGEQLITGMVHRLELEIRSGEMAARLGEARFALWLEGDGESDLSARINYLQRRLSEPLPVQGAVLHLRLRMGVCLFPGDGHDAESLLQQAGTAMLLHASQLDRSAWMRFNHGMNAALRQTQKLQIDLRAALKSEQLDVHYQPFVELDSGRIVGAEALLRWTHPEQGNISPDVFIPLAEEDSSLINALGAWVLGQACTRVARWRQHYDPSLFIAVNVSVRQMETAGFHQLVAHALMTHGLPPDAIELELTESIAASGAPELEANLRALQEMGVALAIDDFGTGYASFGYLRRFPAVRLKVDRQFFEDVPDNQQRSNLVRMIVAMGHTLGAQIIGEGVETAAQAAFLKEVGGDFAQGYFFSRPLPPEKIEPLLEQQPFALPRP
jgi:diguanylate cyclase (GGDEF)-like protein